MKKIKKIYKNNIYLNSNIYQYRTYNQHVFVLSLLISIIYLYKIFYNFNNIINTL